MTSYQVEVLNSEADEVLQDLAKRKLISLKKSNHEKFLAILETSRRRAVEIGIPTEEEITKEVEEVRAARYARNQAGR